ncbi:quinolinate synthase NadA [Candidatus Micrarchaeota archaeon]|nr:quinolinate synthase NadA [Candidatus Micrarchaeota archaeon]
MEKTPLFTDAEIEEETNRLQRQLARLNWSPEACRIYAPMTLEIHQLKKKKNAVILAHSYQTPDIIYGVADFVGDSYGLSVQASKTSADTIVFCGVRFMAETAKILSPQKTVILPAPDAGCSLAESITGADVRKLKQEHPNAGVVCYVNTNADVKAECDVICTSANALKIVEAMPQNEILFLPDEYMAKNIARETEKKIISWKGRCIVHEEFNERKIKAVKKQYPGVKILVHTECAPSVIREADLAGGTSDMVRYAKTSDARQFMLVTECGLSDRMRVEMPEKEFVGTCNLCPYMKRVSLSRIQQALENPQPDQFVYVNEPIRGQAFRSLKKMLEIGS